MPRSADAAKAELNKLGNIVARLNGEDQTSAPLRHYVDGWLTAKRHFGQWQKTNPDLDSSLQNVVSGTHYFLLSSQDGRAQPHLRFYHPVGNQKPVQESARYACLAFSELASSPLRDRVGKCDRCGRYYVSEGAYLRKRFCSRSCAKSEFAVRATQRRREQETEQKRRAVAQAIHALETRRRRPVNWKEWVSEQAGVTKKWITRAINRGEIRPPETSEKQKKTNKRRAR